MAAARGARLRTAVLAAVLTLAAAAGSPQVGRAATVDCSDPQVVSALRQARSAYAQLLSLYAQLPAAERAMIDQQTRRATGYTIPQLRQLIADCGSAPTSRPTPRPTPRSTFPPMTTHPPKVSPTPARPTAPPTPRSFRPDQYTFAPPAAPRRTTGPALLSGVPPADPRIAAARSGPPALSSDVVYIGEGRLKLGWQLFSRTDLTDKEAADLWAARSNARLADLEAQRTEAQAEQAEWAKRARLVEEAGRHEDIAKVTAALQDDFTYFSDLRAEQLKAAALAATGLGPLGPVGDVIGAYGTGSDYAEVVKDLWRTSATGERWTLAQTERAASFAAGAAGFGATVAKMTPAVGEVIAGGQVLSALAQAAYADIALQRIDLQIQRPLDTLAAHQAMLASREASAARDAAALAREIAWRTRERDAMLRFAGR